MLAICESLSTWLDRGLGGGLATAEASATLAGAAGGAGFGVASTMTEASASGAAYGGRGLNRAIPLSADASASILDTGSTSASAQSAGKRKFTLSDGARPASAMSARALSATMVDDASCGESPARALKPAARPPSPAPPRMARHASTLLLIPQDRLLDRLRLDRPRMSPRTADPAPNVGFIFFAKRASLWLRPEISS